MDMYYVLEGKKPVPAPNAIEWAKWFEGGNREVALTMVSDIKVSTVFLGLNHQYGNGPPLIFETMIFEGEHDGYQDRYSTWKEAEAGHEKAVKLAKTGK